LEVSLLVPDQIGKTLCNRSMQAADGAVVLGTGHHTEATPKNHGMIQISFTAAKR
jgi:hypothetical protein